MRVPLSWLNEYVDPGLEPEALADVLTIGGLAVEAILRPTAGTRGVVVAEVLDMARIEGSDKLHLVHVTDGTSTHEIVCGASNYRPGDKVAAALPGAVLTGSFEIGARKLFGHTSGGMLASARELGVGEDHSGIWVLDDDAPVGDDVTEWLGLDDAVLELEITPDRGYALSILGIARDVSALTGAELRMPAVSDAVAGDTGVPVTIDDPAACPRFDARRIAGVTVRTSPAWVQRRLAAAGMRAVSSIVDATNLSMLETGHPAHAYDLERLAGPSIAVRRARTGESFTTLDGVDRTCRGDDLLIADADGPVGFAGAMGAERTEVHEGTTTVLLEVAAFDPASVLRTARRHQLLTEASKRFEKTIPAATVPFGAARCADLIVQLAGGTVSGFADHGGEPAPPTPIVLRPDRARSLLGVDIDDGEQAALLERIDCVVERTAAEVAVTPPAWRPDLRIEVDLYEEIARLYGYDRIPESLPSSGQVGGRDARDEAVRAVRRALAGAGWSEALLLPFAAAGDVDALHLPSDDRRRDVITLVNPLSKEESVLRTSLLPGLLQALRRNVNRQVTDVALFEVGRAFLPPTPDDPAADGGPGGVALPAEPLIIAFAACGNFDTPRHDRPGRTVDVYDVLGAVEVIRTAIGLPPLDTSATDEQPYHPGRAARLRLGGVDIGVVGELHPRVIEAFDVPPRTVAGELRLDRLTADGRRPPQPVAPSALPGARFDVAVIVAEDVPAGAVEHVVAEAAGDKVTFCRLFDVFTGAQIGEGSKSLAYALRLDDAHQQLTDADVTAAIARIEEAVAGLGGRLRR